MNEINDKLEKLSNKGIFHILAFDHRGSFKKMMQAHSDREVTDEDAIALKKAIIEPLKGMISGVLIDQDYGLPAYRSLQTSVPFLLPTEKTGYVDTDGERVTELQYSGESIIEEGASAMKVLIYANNNVTTWGEQTASCIKAYEDAHANNLPLFLEFVLYDVGEKRSGNIVEVLQSAMSSEVKADVWKIPYPGSTEMCVATTKLVGSTPWVLLTGGTSFEGFLEQYKVSKGNGASGFVAGRALWQEACALWQQPEELDTFLNVELVRRCKVLIEA